MRFGEVKEPRVGCEPKGLFAQSKEGFIHGYAVMLSNVAGFDIAAVNCLPTCSSNDVNGIIRVLGSARFKTDAAWVPPSRGMGASKRIGSGFDCVAKSLACTPSSTSPQISYPSCSSRERMRRRVDGLSSA